MGSSIDWNALSAPEHAAGAWLGLDALDVIKVLLVEDDPVTRWLVRCALKDECRLITADAANQAFIACQNYRPDLVFLDMGLPDKNGSEVLQWIMRNDPGVRVVIFSGTMNEDDLSNAMMSGARGFIPKPFVKHDFLQHIHKY